MTPLSAGILLYRKGAEGPEVLLVHPGGPFWRRRDQGAWQLPKGGVDTGEDAEAAARREFAEELGAAATGTLVPLGTVRQAGGKRVTAFAMEGDFDCAALSSVSFEIEWPPKSGRRASFPEVDQARWFSLPDARAMMLGSQTSFLDRLEALLAGTAARS